MKTHHKSPHLIHLQYRPDIDGLRAIAILLVVGFHAFPKKIASGFIGVDVFFVISGFLISSIVFSSLERERFSLLEFYYRRIRRIFPALLLVMAASLVFGSFALFPDEYEQLGKHIAGGAGFVSNFMLWGESGYFDHAAKTKPMLHLWSLAIEEQFYIFWPLLLAAAWKRKWSFLKITALIAAASFAVNVYLAGRNPTEAFYSPLPRFWELMTGGILAFITLHKPQINSRHQNSQSIAGAVLLLIGCALLNQSRAFPGWWALLPTFGTALIISAGPAAWFNRKFLSNRILVWIGLISYPLYLWHWPLLSFGMIMENVDAPAPDMRNPALLLSFVLAWLTYRIVEAPFRDARHGRAKVGGLLVFMVLIGCVGYVIYESNGAKFRTTTATAEPYSYDFRFPPPFLDICAYPMKEHDKSWDFCNDGNVARDPSVVLLGDSVAGSFSQTLLYATKYFPFTFKQFGRAQCPPLLHYGPPLCVEAYRYYYDWIKNSSSAKVVVLAAAWPEYVDGKNYDYAVPPQKFSGAEFQKAFVRSIAFLAATHKKIVVFLSPPEGAKPRACLPRPFKVNDICQLQRNVAIKNDRESRNLIRKLLAPFPQVKVYDPFSFLCDTATCKVSENHKIFYIDGVHMSTEGGEFLAEKSQGVLKELLRK